MVDGTDMLPIFKDEGYIFSELANMVDGINMLKFFTDEGNTFSKKGCISNSSGVVYLCS